MSRPTFDPVMLANHPAVQVVVGLTQSGKSTYLAMCIQRWRQTGRQVLAIDGVCTNPPARKHIAYWSDWWAERPPQRLPAGASLLACDEAAIYLTASRKAHPLIRECVFRGQHLGTDGVSCILATQRAKMIHIDAWSQAQRVVVFRTNDARDLERIAELAGMTPEVLRLIPHLPTGYAVVWDMRDGIFVPYVPSWHSQRPG